MKRLTILVWLMGALGAVALILWSDASRVGEAVASTGWGVLLVVLARVVTVVCAGMGWNILFPSLVRPRLSVCVLLRIVREGVNTLLPFTQIGGDFVGARLLTFFHVRGALAGASIIVDVMVQAGTQFLFALVGLGLLIALGGNGEIVRIAAIGLALSVPALAGFYLVQRRWGRQALHNLLKRTAGDRQWHALGAVDALYGWLQSFYAGRATLAGGSAVHLAGWFLGALEVAIALAFMGHPVGFAEALVIESLSQAIRGAAFAIPGALGVQEGGLLVLCALFGIPAQAALALSIVKRMADLGVGAPGLLAWQAIEGRQLMRRRGRGGGA